MPMPIPGSEDAPQFNEEHASELLRFISQIEDLFSAHKIETDKDKKIHIGQYTTAITESEWKAFESFKTGTWADYKKEIIRSYPDAAALETGSIARLERMLNSKGRRKPIRENDLADLLSLKRSFCAEVSKLQMTPQLISNRELVAKFFSCLHPDFVRRIEERQDLFNDLNTKGKLTATITRIEDRFVLDDVIETAVTFARRAYHANRRYNLEEHLKVSNIQSTDKSLHDHAISKLQERIATLDNVVQLHTKEMQYITVQLDYLFNEINGLQSRELMTTALPAGASTPASNWAAHYARNNRSAKSDGHTGICFYCNETGHRIIECPHVAKHISYGWIIRNEFHKVRLPDGQLVPTDGNKSMKEVIELRNRVYHSAERLDRN